MSSDLKPGDVCEILDGKTPGPIERQAIGRECEVLTIYGRTMGFGGAYISDAVEVFVPGLGSFLVQRSALRKKRPPADDSQWIRQDTVPREQFDRWREHVRYIRTVREKEPA